MILTGEPIDRRPRQLLLGITSGEEERSHPNKRYDYLPKSLCLLTDHTLEIGDTGSVKSGGSTQDKMVAELWDIFDKVEGRKIRLEDAPRRYRDILSAPGCGNDELAASLEDLELPSDHIGHGDHKVDFWKGPGDEKFAMLLEEIARLVRLYRSEELRVEDLLSLLREKLVGVDEGGVMDYAWDPAATWRRWQI